MVTSKILIKLARRDSNQYLDSNLISLWGSKLDLEKLNPNPSNFYALKYNALLLSCFIDKTLTSGLG